MVGCVTFDQTVRLFLCGADRVALERDGRGNLCLDRSPDVAGFRAPVHMISNLKVPLSSLWSPEIQAQDRIIVRIILNRVSALSACG